MVEPSRTDVLATDRPRAAERVGPHHYEIAWTPNLERIRTLRDLGETSLARVVRLTETAWRANIGSKGVAYGKPVILPPAALVGGRQAHRTQTILSECRPDTDLIVELGSGWGNNLAEAYLAGGPRDAAYWAMEITSSGRACAAELAALEAEWRLSVASLDFFAPDYSALPRGGRHALIFTSHSIEQIDVLPEAAITGLLDLAVDVTGVHFEPIGWQMERDVELGASEAYSRARNYNTNLWPILKGLAERGLIDIVEAVPDIFHQKRSNISTLVVWRKRKG